MHPFDDFYNFDQKISKFIALLSYSFSKGSPIKYMSFEFLIWFSF